MARESQRDKVIDLKPDGYQLKKFKEELVKLLAAGTRDHTPTAFWEYLIIGEIVKQTFNYEYKTLYVRDPRATDAIDKLKPFHETFMEDIEGDFSERMMILLVRISSNYRENHGSTSDAFLTTSQVTDLIHKTDLRELTSHLLDFLKLRDRTVLLIENIDKGWETRGIDSDDVVIVRSLSDALRKFERQASRNETAFDWLLFLRNNVFELLIGEQNDRGKQDVILVDWESAAALRSVIERRINISTPTKANPNGSEWYDIACKKIDGMDTLDWLVQRSLMRPRYLIQLVRECLGHAAASGKTKIDEDDSLEGYRLYSLDIIGNTNYELQDIYPRSFEAVYCLIGSPRRTSLGNIRADLKDYGYEVDAIDEVIRLMFWFGVLGTETKAGTEKYIFDYRYDERVFNIVRKPSKGSDEIVYINQAFARGLDCS